MARSAAPQRCTACWLPPPVDAFSFLFHHATMKNSATHSTASSSVPITLSAVTGLLGDWGAPPPLPRSALGSSGESSAPVSQLPPLNQGWVSACRQNAVVSCSLLPLPLQRVAGGK